MYGTIVVGRTRWIGCRPQALLHSPAAVHARRREGGVPCRLDIQSCTWPFLGQQGVHAAAAFRGGVCGGYLVVLLLVDDEEEDVAVEEEREVIYSNCQVVCGIGLATIIWKAWPPISHVPTQLDYVCLRTLNPLEVDFFNLYFEIGAMLLFFMLLKSAILCDLYLLTYIICAIETPCDANLFLPFVSIHFFQ